jgi:glucokinase
MIATIDMGGTSTKFGLVHEGEIICASICDADAQGSLQGHLDEVLQRLKVMCAERGVEFSDIEGLGLLSTGLVDSVQMKVLSTNGKYDEAVDFDFVGWAQRKAGLRLRMENDARGALLGEWKYGAARGVDNVLMVTFGTGVGTAVIADGKPLRGASFSGGGLGGHIIVKSGGRDCTCGGKGCLEAEASGWALPQLIKEHALYGQSSLRELPKTGFRELIEHAKDGDPCAGEIWAHCLRTWGEAMVSFIHLIDPELIVIGGGLMNDPEPVLESFRQTISELAWGGAPQVELVKAEHPNNAALLGASALFSNVTP